MKPRVAAAGVLGRRAGMYRYGKTAQTAVAVASFLAGRHDDGATRWRSQTIAEARDLPVPLVAKILTMLSTAGLVNGTRGPGGGYWLARPPDRIALADIVARFERDESRTVCPYGPGWCGQGPHCPLHDRLLAMDAALQAFLAGTTLEVFRAAGPGGRPAAPSTSDDVLPAAPARRRPGGPGARLPGVRRRLR